MLLVFNVEVCGGHHRIEMLEEERARTAPIVAFDYGFPTQGNADTFPILICRDNRYAQTERHVVNGTVPQHTQFCFLWVSSKILVLEESFCNAMINQVRNHSKML